MKRKIASALVLLLSMTMLSGCGFPLKRFDAVQERDGVRLTLKNASARKKGQYRVTFFTYDLVIENLSDVGIMQVNYDLIVYDRDGNELESFPLRYYGETSVIAPGEKYKIHSDNLRRKLDRNAAALGIQLKEVYDEQELPIVVLPQKGQYLYEVTGNAKLANIKNDPPCEIRFGIDRGGYLREAVFTDEAEIAEAVKLLTQIRIGEETNEFVTDNYNYISLLWADGSKAGISLNLYTFELNVRGTVHGYKLDGLGAFWDYGEERAVEAER